MMTGRLLAMLFFVDAICIQDRPGPYDKRENRA
jgi:hypothetical protein